VSNLLGSLFNKMPDFFKSKGFEFIIEPPKQIFGSKLTEEDYDTSKDLKGDNRAWNQEYMKNIKQKTSNFGVTDRQITDASEYR
jgi:hypothetical protein